MAGTPNLRKLYTGLYLNITFLFVRNIFRFVEFTQSTVLGCAHTSLFLSLGSFSFFGGFL